MRGHPLTPRERYERQKAYTAAWRARDPAGYAASRARHAAKDTTERQRARHKVLYALNIGLLRRPSACDDCRGTVRKLHAHHYQGYDRPLVVRWLCQPCHSLAHDIGELGQRRAVYLATHPRAQPE